MELLKSTAHAHASVDCGPSNLRDLVGLHLISGLLNVASDDLMGRQADFARF